MVPNGALVRVLLRAAMGGPSTTAANVARRSHHPQILGPLTQHRTNGFQ